MAYLSPMKRIKFKSSFKFFIQCILTFSIINAPIVGYSAEEFSLPRSSTAISLNEPTAEDNDKWQGQITYAEQILELQNSIFRDKGRSSAQLDPFMMTRQQVIDDRQAKIAALIEEEAIEDHNDRVEHFERKVRSLSQLEALAKIKLNKAKNNEQRIESTVILEDISSRLAIARIELEDAKEHDPRAGNGYNLQSFIDPELRTRHYFGRKMKIQVLDLDENVLAEINQSDFANSLLPNFNAENEVPSDVESKGFKILKPNGTVLHNFDIDASSILFFGQFIVFIEKNSLQENGYQPIHFIDLRYAKLNIGNAPLPVFTLPINSESAPNNVSITSGKLKVDDVNIAHEQLAFISQSQQTMFNASVALISPETYDSGKELIEEIYTHFDKAMTSQTETFARQMQEVANTASMLEENRNTLNTQAQMTSEELQAKRALIAKAKADGLITEEEFEPLNYGIEKSMARNGLLESTNSGLSHSRKLLTRTRMFWEYLKQPRPEGAPKLQNALLSLATAKTSEDRSRVYTLTKDRMATRILKYGAMATGAVLASQLLPESYNIFYYQAIDLISATHDHFMGYLSHIGYGKHYGELSKDAFITSTTGFTYFYSSYISDGKWLPFLWGLGSVLKWPILFFGGLHGVVNSVSMFLKIKKQFKSNKEERLSFIEAFHRAAVKDKERDDRVRAETEKKVSGSNLSEMTEDDVQLLTRNLERIADKTIDMDPISAHQYLQRRQEKFSLLKKGYRTTLLGFVKVKDLSTRVVKKASEFKGVIKVKEATQNTRDTLSSLKDRAFSESNQERVQMLGFGLKQFFMSSASLSTTYRFNINFWNFLYAPRVFAFSPSKWVMAAVYPKFYSSAIDLKKKHTFPSTYNNGLDGPLKTALKSISKNAGFLGYVPYLNRMLISKSSLYQLKKFEAITTPIEAEAIKFALRKSQMALIEVLPNAERVSAIFDSTQESDSITAGITSLYDQKLNKLTKKEREYFRVFFTHTYNAFMASALTELDFDNVLGSEDLHPELMGQRVRDQIASGNIRVKKPTKAELESALESAKSSLNFEKIKEETVKTTESILHAKEKLAINFRHRLLDSVNPQNFALIRTLIAKKQVKDRAAVDRVKRAEISGLLFSLPISLLSALGLYAGVQSGVLMPFDPNGLNTDTHLNYMSRNLFYGGFLPGVITGILGSPWLKIQQDSRVDQLSGFGQTIKFSDSKKGYWRFFLKNFVKNPKNKWVSNQLHYMKIIIANLPAAMTVILPFQYLALGRIDAGLIMDSYIVMFITVFMGLNLKLDQAFELSKSWVSSRIPRKFRAHPKAQDYIDKKVQVQRYKFTLFETAWAVALVENVAGSMFSIKDNVNIGTRAFLRLVFGGDTPTELISKGVNSVASATQGIPGSQQVTDWVHNFFTNRYEAFERFPQELIDQAPNAERVFEDPSLPQNLVGEFLGKAIGAVTTLGGFALAPYAISFTYEEFKRKWLQKRGAEAQYRLDLINTSGGSNEAVDAEPSQEEEALESQTAAEEVTHDVESSAIESAGGPITCSGLLN